MRKPGGILNPRAFVADEILRAIAAAQEKRLAVAVRT